MSADRRTHRSFTLVLGGGGARGFAHAGVLRALEHYGLHPSAIVGVSMGAVVGTAYAARRDWYPALSSFAEQGLPETADRLPGGRPGKRSRLRRLASGARAVWHLGHGWGASDEEVRAGRAALDELLGRANLEDGRVPVAVSATDLLSGNRIVLREGSASSAAYASSALAGVLPPLRLGTHLLADGAYTDICPIDVARRFGCDRVVAVHPGRSDVIEDVRNGLQGLMRATEICYLHHAALRFEQADIVIHPTFRRAVDTLDFAAYRECMAAGAHAVRTSADALTRVLGA